MAHQIFCNCGSPARFACANCFTLFYCSKSCQTRDWVRGHKREGMPGGCSPRIVRDYMRATGRTPLHMCAMAEATESMGLMLRFGVSTEHRDSGGLTPLMLAAEQGKLEALTCLLDGGAQIDATSVRGDSTISALMCAFFHANTNFPQGMACVRLLLARGASIAVLGAEMAAALLPHVPPPS